MCEALSCEREEWLEYILTYVYTYTIKNCYNKMVIPQEKFCSERIDITELLLISYIHVQVAICYNMHDSIVCRGGQMQHFIIS